jgi:S1-C subfamily serine protease
VEANGKRVRRLSDLTDTIEQVGVGRSVEITVSHDGQERKLEIQIVDISRS